jgi:MFS family permease
MVLIHTLTHVAGSVRGSIFPLIKDEFTLTNQQIGLIAAIPSICEAVFTLPAGALSDRFGAKRLITLSIGMAAIGTALAAFTQNIPLFILATTFLTLNSTIYHPPAHSYVLQTSILKDTATVLGILNAGGIFGFALGPFSVTILIDILGFSWRQVYLFWLPPILLGLAVLYFLKTKPRKKVIIPSLAKNGTEQKRLLSGSMVAFLLSSGVRMLGGGMTTAFLSIYLVESRGWSLGFVGVLYGISRLLGLVASPLGGLFASRFGEKRWAILSLFTSYTCFLLAFLTDNIILFMIFYLSHSFCGTLGMTATSAITAILSPRKQRGLGFALSFLPGSIVRAIGPVVAAFIADSLGMYSIFMTSTMVYFIGLSILQFGVRIE